MSASRLASTALPPIPALTTILFKYFHEDHVGDLDDPGHATTSRHPYCFTSRIAASRFANTMCDRYGFDSYRLDTPGYVPPRQLLVFDDSDLPY